MAPSMLRPPQADSRRSSSCRENWGTGRTGQTPPSPPHIWLRTRLIYLLSPWPAYSMSACTMVLQVSRRTSEHRRNSALVPLVSLHTAIEKVFYFAQDRTFDISKTPIDKLSRGLDRLHRGRVPHPGHGLERRYKFNMLIERYVSRSISAFLAEPNPPDSFPACEVCARKLPSFL